VAGEDARDAVVAGRCGDLHGRLALGIFTGADASEAVVDQLSGYGARGWQIALVAPLIVRAILDADSYSAGDPESEGDSASGVSGS